MSMKPVLSLIENNTLRSVDNVLCYFITAVSREAVHEYCI